MADVSSLLKFLGLGSEGFGEPSSVGPKSRERQVREGLKSIEAGNERGGMRFIQLGFNNLSPEEQEALLQALPAEEADIVRQQSARPVPPQNLKQFLFGGEGGS